MTAFTQHTGASADPLVDALLSGSSGISIEPGSVKLNASAPAPSGITTARSVNWGSGRGSS